MITIFKYTQMRKIISITVVILFAINNISFGFSVYSENDNRHTLSPNNRFNPIYGDDFVITGDITDPVELTENLKDDAGLLYVSKLIGKILAVNGSLVSARGVRKILSRHINSLDEVHFDWENLYKEGRTICLPLRKGYEGDVTMLRYFSPDDKPEQAEGKISLPVGIENIRVIIEQEFVRAEEQAIPAMGSPDRAVTEIAPEERGEVHIADQALSQEERDSGPPAIAVVQKDGAWVQYEISHEQHQVINEVWKDLWDAGYGLPEKHELVHRVMVTLLKNGIESDVHIHSPPAKLFYDRVYRLAGEKGVIFPKRGRFMLITHPGTYRDRITNMARSCNLLIPGNALDFLNMLMDQGLGAYSEWYCHEIGHMIDRYNRDRGAEKTEIEITRRYPLAGLLEEINKRPFCLFKNFPFENRIIFIFKLLRLDRLAGSLVKAVNAFRRILKRKEIIAGNIIYRSFSGNITKIRFCDEDHPRRASELRELDITVLSGLLFGKGIKGEEAGRAILDLGRADRRCFDNGLLSAEVTAYSEALRRQINPRREGLAGLYGGAGADASRYFLSTDADVGVFAVKTERFDVDTIDETERERIDKEIYKKHKFDRGYGPVLNHASVGETIWPFLKLELIDMGADPDSIQVSLDSGANWHILFDWNGRKREVIYLLGADMTKTAGLYRKIDSIRPVLNGFSDIVQRTRMFDLYYQNAAQAMSVRYGHYMEQVLDMVKPGGWILTNDYAFTEKKTEKTPLTGNGYSYENMMTVEEPGTGLDFAGWSLSGYGEGLSLYRRRYIEPVSGREIKTEGSGEPMVAVFDVHGTILKPTWKEEYALAYSSLTGRDAEHAWKWVERIAGYASWDEVLKELKKDISREIPDRQITVEFTKARHRLQGARVPGVMPGAMDFIKALRRMKVPVRIVTGSDRALVVKQLKARGFFDHNLITEKMIIARDDVRLSGGKNDYRGEALEIVQSMHPGHRLVWFDDWTEGCAKIRELGGISFGLPQGERREKRHNRGELKAAGVDFILNGWERWPEILLFLGLRKPGWGPGTPAFDQPPDSGDEQPLYGGRVPHPGLEIHREDDLLVKGRYCLVARVSGVPVAKLVFRYDPEDDADTLRVDYFPFEPGRDSSYIAERLMIRLQEEAYRDGKSRIIMNCGKRDRDRFFFYDSMSARLGMLVRVVATSQNSFEIIYDVNEGLGRMLSVEEPAVVELVARYLFFDQDFFGSGKEGKQIPGELLAVAERIRKRYPAVNFGWGMDRSDWMVLQQDGGFYLRSLSPERFLCNSAAKEVSGWLSELDIEHWVVEFQNIAEVEPREEVINDPYAPVNVVSENNFMVIARIKDEDFIMGFTPFDQAVLDVYPAAELAARPMVVRHLLSPFSRRGAVNPAELRDMRGEGPLADFSPMCSVPLRGHTLGVSARVTCAMRSGKIKTIDFEAKISKTEKDIMEGVVGRDILHLTASVPANDLDEIQGLLAQATKGPGDVSDNVMRILRSRDILTEDHNGKNALSAEDREKLVGLTARTERLLAELIVATRIKEDDISRDDRVGASPDMGDGESQDVRPSDDIIDRLSRDAIEAYMNGDDEAYERSLYLIRKKGVNVFPILKKGKPIDFESGKIGYEEASSAAREISQMISAAGIPKEKKDLIREYIFEAASNISKHVVPKGKSVGLVMFKLQEYDGGILDLETVVRDMGDDTQGLSDLLEGRPRKVRRRVIEGYEGLGIKRMEKFSGKMIVDAAGKRWAWDNDQEKFICTQHSGQIECGTRWIFRETFEVSAGTSVAGSTGDPAAVSARKYQESVEISDADRPVSIKYNTPAMMLLESSNPGLTAKIEKILTTSFSDLVEGEDYYKVMGRSVILKLDTPFNAGDHVITAVKIKGVVFDAGKLASAREYDAKEQMMKLGSGQGYLVTEKTRLFGVSVDEDGYFVKKDYRRQPYGGLRYSDAEIEYSGGIKTFNAGFNVGVSLAYGMFVGEQCADGDNTGFCITGIEDIESERAAEQIMVLAEGYSGEVARFLDDGEITPKMQEFQKHAKSFFFYQGMTLKRLNDAGYYHGNFHMGNFGFENGKVAIYDTENTLSAEDLTPEQFFGYIVQDVRAALQSVRRYHRHMLFGKLGCDWTETFLQGYFGEEATPLLELYCTSEELGEILTRGLQQPVYTIDHPLVNVLWKDFREKIDDGSGNREISEGEAGDPSQGTGGQSEPSAIALVEKDNELVQYELSHAQHSIINRVWGKHFRGWSGSGYELGADDQIYQDFVAKLKAQSPELRAAGINALPIHIHSPPAGLLYDEIYALAETEGVKFPARGKFKLITHPGTGRSKSQEPRAKSQDTHPGTGRTKDEGRGMRDDENPGLEYHPRSYNMLIPREELYLLQWLKRYNKDAYDEWLDHETAHIADRAGNSPGNEADEISVTEHHGIAVFIESYNTFAEKKSLMAQFPGKTDLEPETVEGIIRKARHPVTPADAKANLLRLLADIFVSEYPAHKEPILSCFEDVLARDWNAIDVDTRGYVVDAMLLKVNDRDVMDGLIWLGGNMEGEYKDFGYALEVMADAGCGPAREAIMNVSKAGRMQNGREEALEYLAKRQGGREEPMPANSAAGDPAGKELIDHQKRIAQDFIDTIIMHVLAAGRRGVKIMIGMDTSSMPDNIPFTDSEFQNIIETVKDLSEPLGIDNIIFVKGQGEGLVNEINLERRKRGINKADLIILGKKEHVENGLFDRLNEGEFAGSAGLFYQTGVDTAAFSKTEGDLFEEQRVRLLEMLLMTIELAYAGQNGRDILLEDFAKEYPYVSITKSDKIPDVLIFVPEAEPVDIGLLEDLYKAAVEVLVKA